MRAHLERLPDVHKVLHKEVADFMENISSYYLEIGRDLQKEADAMKSHFRGKSEVAAPVPAPENADETKI